MKYLSIEEHFNCELLHEIFKYESQTGLLSWRFRDKDLADKLGMTQRGLKQFNTRYAGKKAGSRHSAGYLHLNINIKLNRYSGLVHRIIWVMEFKEVPDTIDHIDGDKLNNKIVNLRNVCTRDNSFNCKTRNDSSSGVTGVSYRKQRSKWRAYCFIGGKQFTLGHYVTFAEAIEARKNWEISSGYLFREKA
jgi:hypothetical protein